MSHSTESSRLTAERAISKVIFDYCQGVDRRDWDQVRTCYHPDAIDSHGAFVGGPEEFLDFVRRRHDHVISSIHFVSNLSMRFREDERMARVESYLLSLQIVDASAGDPFAGQSIGTVFTRIMARYVDTFQWRPDGGWRIWRRTVVNEWMLPPEPASFMPIDPSWPQPARDQTDPLYAPWPDEN
jgi:hypothetical protein